MISLKSRILQADSQLQEIVVAADYYKNTSAACALFSVLNAVEVWGIWKLCTKNIRTTECVRVVRAAQQDSLLII